MIDGGAAHRVAALNDFTRGRECNLADVRIV